MYLRMLWPKAQMLQRRTRGCITFSSLQAKVAVLGIDFGCKNSRVAMIDSLVPQVVQSEMGRFTPSYVTLTQLNSSVPYRWALQCLERAGRHAVVGELAKRKVLRQPSDVVFNIKKMIGKQFGDDYIQEMRRRVCFRITEGPRGEAWVEIHGMEFSPVEITSVIFAKLLDIVLMYEYHDKLKAVISVPTFFSEQQRENIMIAGNRAGLEILQLIEEPIAAALSSSTVKEGTVAVFCMGAGSYGVSILHVSDTNIVIKTQFDDPSLGGDQFDYVLLEHFVTQIIKLHSVDIHDDKYAMAILAEAVEKAKVELSRHPSATVSIPNFTGSVQGVVNVNITISRQEFEKLVDNLIQQIQDKCQSILNEANITCTDIDEVVLAGGMTRVPKIQSIIHGIFGKHQSTRVNPEEAVVIGCAIQAALIIENQRGIQENLIPLSVGIESAKGIFSRVIPRFTKIPTERTVMIPAWAAYGQRLGIRIFLGEHVMVHRNEELGEVELVNNRRIYQGFVNFELKFEVDEDYLVKVSARNVDDQLEAAGDVKKAFKAFPIRNMVMSKHNVQKAVKVALLDWAMCVEDIHARRRNLARYIINTLDDVLSASKDELPEELRENAEKALSDLQMALSGDARDLQDKMISAYSMETDVLNWKPPSESSHGDYSDYENDN